MSDRERQNKNEPKWKTHVMFLLIKSFTVVVFDFFVTKSLSLTKSSTQCASISLFREFKKLRRLLQRKRHIEIELCVELNVLWWFYVGHGQQTRQKALSLAWHEWVSCKGKEWKIYCCGLRLCRQNLKNKNFTSSFGRLRQKLLEKACRTCSTTIFLHSTNQIICGAVVVVAVVIS